MPLPAKWTFAVAVAVLCLAHAARAGRPLTVQDIPPDMPADVRALVEATFSGGPAERSRAAEALGKLGDRAVPAIPFLIRLLGDDEEYEEEGADEYEDFPSQPSTDAYAALSRIGKPAFEPLLAALAEPGRSGRSSMENGRKTENGKTGKRGQRENGDSHLFPVDRGSAEAGNGGALRIARTVISGCTQK